MLLDQQAHFALLLLALVLLGQAQNRHAKDFLHL
jgi:hypothetical protein